MTACPTTSSRPSSSYANRKSRRTIAAAPSGPIPSRRPISSWSAREQIQSAAADKDGLLAHNASNDSFEIISDEELQQILDGGHELHEARNFVDVIDQPMADTASPDEELELVSTTLLRQMLDPAASMSADEDEPPDSGFDPYNKS